MIEQFGRLDFPRFSVSQKARARGIIIDELQKAGYEAVALNDRTRNRTGLMRDNFNVVTKCEYPEYIVSAHYDTAGNIRLKPLDKLLKRLAVYDIRTFNLFLALLAITLYKISDIIVFNFNRNIDTFSHIITCLISLVLMVPLFKVNLRPAAMFDDNTSGVVGALALARKFKAAGYRNVQFVFFDNEENGRHGSRAFAARIKNDPAYSGVRVINLDCIGRGEKLYIEYEKKFADKLGEFKLLDEVRERNTQRKFPMVLSSTSDCRQFMELGIEALTLIRYDETVFMGRRQHDISWIHTFDDVLEKIDSARLEEVVTVVEVFFMSAGRTAVR